MYNEIVVNLEPNLMSLIGDIVYFLIYFMIIIFVQRTVIKKSRKRFINYIIPTFYIGGVLILIYQFIISRLDLGPLGFYDYSIVFIILTSIPVIVMVTKVLAKKVRIERELELTIINDLT